MKKLSELVKGLYQKFKGLSKLRKIALGIVFLAVVICIAYLSFSLKSTNENVVLFSGLDSTDSKTVIDQLTTKKISYKVKGNAIYVPKNQVDELRLSLAPNIKNGSKGFELFDNTSMFGMTDEQMKIQYQRALEGELERTFKSFPQIEDSKVHLVMPENSVFVKDSTEATASVTLKLKSGQSLKTDQVKAMVALTSGSVKNLPKENVKIVDDKMRLLTEGLYSNKDGSPVDDEEAASATEKQQKLKSNYESNLEKKLLGMLEDVYGKGKVKVNVNADLNFDAVQQSTVKVDPNNSGIVSQKTTKSSGSPSSNTISSGSPTDNSVSSSNSNPIKNSNTPSGASNSQEDTTTNYEISKTEGKTIVAPGQVKRLTASVAVDGALSDEAKTSIKNLVYNTAGVDESRGDSVSVEGIHFDTSLQDNAAKDIDAMNKLAEKGKQNKLYVFAGISLGMIMFALALLGYLRKKARDEEKINEPPAEEENVPGLDVVIGDNVEPKQPEVQFKPIDFEPKDNEGAHIEQEIKKYATKKPDQVVDIVKSWLSEEER